MGGCNDSHTPGYGPRSGQVPEAEWPTGDQLGFTGPWGTSYPTNLRLSFAAMSQEQGLSCARSLQTRPPMPWFTVRDMSDEDLSACPTTQ